MATIQKQGRGYKITVSQGRDYTGKKGTGAWND